MSELNDDLPDLTKAAIKIKQPKPAPNGDKTREKILAQAKRAREAGYDVSDDVAYDFANVTTGESSQSHLWETGAKKGKVKESPRDPKDGQVAVGFSQIKPGTIKKWKDQGRDLDPYNEDDNLLGGLLEFNSIDKADPVARRLGYFGGPASKKLAEYRRTGKIPSGGDFTGTSNQQYMAGTGGMRPQDFPDLSGASLSAPPVNQSQNDNFPDLSSAVIGVQANVQPLPSAQAPAQTKLLEEKTRLENALKESKNEKRKQKAVIRLNQIKKELQKLGSTPNPGSSSQQNIGATGTNTGETRTEGVQNSSTSNPSPQSSATTNPPAPQPGANNSPTMPVAPMPNHPSRLEMTNGKKLVLQTNQAGLQPNEIRYFSLTNPDEEIIVKFDGKDYSIPQRNETANPPFAIKTKDGKTLVQSGNQEGLQKGQIRVRDTANPKGGMAIVQDMGNGQYSILPDESRLNQSGEPLITDLPGENPQLKTQNQPVMTGKRISGNEMPEDASIGFVAKVNPNEAPKEADKNEFVFRQAAKQLGNKIYNRPLNDLEVEALTQKQKNDKKGFVFDVETNKPVDAAEGEYQFNNEGVKESKEFLDKIQPQLEKERFYALSQFIESTLELSDEERQKFVNLGFTPEEIDRAMMDDPRYADARGQRKANKEFAESRYKLYVENDSPRLAQIKALRDIGVVKQEAVDNEIAADVEARKQLKQDLQNPVWYQSYWNTIKEGATAVVDYINPVNAVSDWQDNIPHEFKTISDPEIKKRREKALLDNIRGIETEFGSVQDFQKFMLANAGQEYNAGRQLKYFGKNAIKLLAEIPKTIDNWDAVTEQFNYLGLILPKDYVPSLRTGGNAITYIYNALTGENKAMISLDAPLEERQLYSAFKYFQNWLGDDQYLRRTFSGEMNSALASGVTFLISGYAMKGVKYGSGILGVLTQVGSTYDELRQAGVSADEAKYWSMGIGIPLGYSEQWGIGGQAERMMAKLGSEMSESSLKTLSRSLMQFAKETGKSFSDEFLEEFLQEWGQSTFGDAAIKSIAAKDKSAAEKIKIFLQEVPRQAVEKIPQGIVGGLSGGVLGGATNAVVSGINAVSSRLNPEIESNTESPSLNLGIKPIQEMKPSIPKIESNRPLAETPYTISRQIESAFKPESPRVAVLLTNEDDAVALASIPQEQFSPIPTEQGTLIVNNEKAAAMGLNSIQDIFQYVQENGFESLIGKIEPVADTSQGISVRTEDKDGRELSTSVVETPDGAFAQMDNDLAEFGDLVGKQEIIPTQVAAQKRSEELKNESQIATNQPDSAINQPISEINKENSDNLSKETPVKPTYRQIMATNRLAKIGIRNGDKVEIKNNEKLPAIKGSIEVAADGKIKLGNRILEDKDLAKLTKIADAPKIETAKPKLEFSDNPLGKTQTSQIEQVNNSTVFNSKTGNLPDNGKNGLTGRTVIVNEQSVTLTPEQDARWAEEVEKPLAKAKERRDRTIKQNPIDYQRANEEYKGEAMRISAVKREITGNLTEKEQLAKAKKEASNFIGKEISVDGQNGKVVGNHFGNVKVRFEDGTEKTFSSDKIKPFVGLQSNENPQQNQEVSEKTDEKEALLSNKNQAKLDKLAKDRKPSSGRGFDSTKHSLSDFVKLSGGIKSSNTIDLAAIRDANEYLHKKTKKGRQKSGFASMLRETGADIEDMFRSAVESGFFSDKNTMYSPGAENVANQNYDFDVDDFIEAVAADASGSAKYLTQEAIDLVAGTIEEQQAKYWEDKAKEEGLTEEQFDDAMRFQMFLKKSEVKNILENIAKNGEISETDKNSFIEIGYYENEIPRNQLEIFLAEAVQVASASRSNAQEIAASDPADNSNDDQSSNHTFYAEEIDESEPDGEVDDSFDFADEEKPQETSNKPPKNLLGEEIQPKFQDNLFGTSGTDLEAEKALKTELIEAYGEKTANFVQQLAKNSNPNIARVADDLLKARKLVASKGADAAQIVEQAADGLEIFVKAQNGKMSVAEQLQQQGIFDAEISPEGQEFARQMESGKFSAEFNKSLSEAKKETPKTTLETGDRFTLANHPDEVFEVLPVSTYQNRNFYKIKSLTTGEIFERPFKPSVISQLNFLEKAPLEVSANEEIQAEEIVEKTPQEKSPSAEEVRDGELAEAKAKHFKLPLISVAEGKSKLDKKITVTISNQGRAFTTEKTIREAQEKLANKENALKNLLNCIGGK